MKLVEMRATRSSPSTATTPSPPPIRRRISPRKHISIEYQHNDYSIEAKVPQPQSPPPKLKKPQFKPPQNWKQVYDTLKQFRYEKLPPAPVDTMGCDQLFAGKSSDRDRRFQILISLLLSSQTKDPVTAEAMQNLHRLSNDTTSTGLSVDVVLQSTDEQINACIAKVGFHRKKTKFIRQVAEICKNRYQNDIPASIDELLELPGIGPKMAYLALQAAWNRVEGIGVDTHVHRISSRLKWVPASALKQGPESTRHALESWMPRELWSEVNHLLVGLGQIVCTPRNPKCSECDARFICPSSSSSSTTKNA